MNIRPLTILTLPLLLATLTGCVTQRSTLTRYAPCHQTQIIDPPIWTASAAWTSQEDRVILVGPERHSLLLYGLDGELEREVNLDAMAEFEYATSIRFLELEDGYLIGDKETFLWLDHDFKKRRLWKPFEDLKKTGIVAGGLRDFTIAGRTIYAFADFVWDDGEQPKPKKSKKIRKAKYDESKPLSPIEGELPPEGNWFRGFAKIDLDEPEIVTLHRFGSEDMEITSYYTYGRRYVTDLGKQVFVLRYSDPPQLQRTSRGNGLETIYTASSGDDFKITSVMSWKGRLFLRGFRRLETAEEGELEGKTDQPTTPTVLSTAGNPASLLAMSRAQAETTVQRLLIEVDPKSGDTLGVFRLPPSETNMKLVPGEYYWAMIEESSIPNIKPDDKVKMTLLPSSWLDRRRDAADSEVILDCPTG